MRLRGAGAPLPRCPLLVVWVVEGVERLVLGKDGVTDAALVGVEKRIGADFTHETRTILRRWGDALIRALTGSTGPWSHALTPLLVRCTFSSVALAPGGATLLGREQGSVVTDVGRQVKRLFRHAPLLAAQCWANQHEPCLLALKK